jgi:hypothetical protein
VSRKCLTPARYLRIFFENLILSLGGFCHVARALMYCIADFWPWIDRNMAWAHRLAYKMHFSLSSSEQEVKSAIRRVTESVLWVWSYWHLAKLHLVRPYFSRSLSIVDYCSASTEPIEWLYVYHTPRNHSNFPSGTISVSPCFLRESLHKFFSMCP